MSPIFTDGYNRDSAIIHEVEISLLENSIYFFITCAFIRQERNGCRLIVTHQERLLLDHLYATVKGAKIAFTKRYGYRLWQQGVRPVWTAIPDQM